MNENGETKLYDIFWESGQIDRNMKVEELEALKSSNHVHQENEIDTPLKERTKKLDRDKLRKILIQEAKIVLNLN